MEVITKKIDSLDMVLVGSKTKNIKDVYIAGNLSSVPFIGKKRSKAILSDDNIDLQLNNDDRNIYAYGKNLNVTYLNKALLPFLENDKEVYYAIKKIFDEDFSIASIVFFSSFSQDPSDSRKYIKNIFYYPSNKLYPNIKSYKYIPSFSEIEIYSSKKLANIIEQSINIEQIKDKQISDRNIKFFLYKIAERSFVKEINNFLEDRYSTILIFEGIAKLAKKCSTQEASSEEYSLVSQDLSSINRNIASLILRRPPKGVKTSVSAQKIVDNIEWILPEAKLLKKLASIVNKMLDARIYKEYASALSELLSLNLEDIQYRYIKKEISRGIKQLELLFDTNKYKQIEIKNTIKTLKFLNLCKLSSPTLKQSSLSIFSGEINSFEELDEALKTLPLSAPIFLEMEEKTYMQELQNKENFKTFLKNILIFKDKNKIYFSGITNQEAKETIFLKGLPKELKINNLNYRALSSNLQILFSEEDNWLKYVSNNIKATKEMQNINIFFDFLKKNKKDVYVKLSPFPSLSLKSKIFNNPLSLINSLSDKVSIEEISKDPSMINALYFTPGLDNVVRQIAKSADLDIPKPSNIIVKPSEGTATLIRTKDELMSGSDNLGMLKFRYTPVLDVTSKEDKEAFLKIIKQEYPETKGMEELQELLEKSSYITVFSEKIVVDKLIYSKPVVCLIDDMGEVIETLSIDIYKYVQMLEKNKIVEYKHLAKTPFATTKIQLNIVTGIGKFLRALYLELLDKNYTHLIKKVKIMEANKGRISSLKEKIAKNIAYHFYIPLANKGILTLDLKKIVQNVNMLPISPILKKEIITETSKTEAICNSTRLEKILIRIQKADKDTYNIVESTIKKIISEIKLNTEKANKEALSFYFFSKIQNSLLEVKQESNPHAKKEYLEETYNLIKKWAEQALGLFPDQIETAINTIILAQKKGKIESHIYHSMGTGKTRMAIFHLFLLMVTNKSAEAYYGVQAKNQADIIEQLKDMFPTLSKATNLITKDTHIASSQNIEVPISLVEYVFPNIFSTTTDDIFVSNSLTNIKKELDIHYVSDIREIYQWTLNKENYLEQIQNLLDARLYSAIPLIERGYRNIILDDIRKIGTSIKKSLMDTYLDKSLRAASSSLVFIQRCIDNGNINPTDKNMEKIVKKTTSIYSDYFTAALKYEKYQKQNRINIFSRIQAEYFPNKTKVISKISPRWNMSYKNNITTKQNILAENINASYSLYIEPTKTGVSLKEHFLRRIAPYKYNENNIILFYKTKESDLFSIEWKDEIYKAICYYLAGNNNVEVLSDVTKKEHIRQIAQLFTRDIDFKDKIETVCPYVLDGGAPIKAEALPLNKLYKNLDVDKFNTIMEKADEYDDFTKTAKTLLYEQDTMLKILNNYFYAKLLSAFMDGDKMYKEKNELMTLHKRPSTELNIKFINKIIDKSGDGIILGYAKSPSSREIGYLKYKGSTKIEIDKKNPLKKIPTQTIEEKVEIGYSRGKFSSELFFKDIPLQTKNDMKHNFSIVYEPKFEKNRNIHITIDEAHKRIKNERFLAHEIGASINAHTGTPTGGTPESLANTLYGKQDNQEFKIMYSLLSSNAGIREIRHKEALPFLTFDSLREDFLKICKYGFEKNVSDLVISELLDALRTKYKPMLSELSDKTSKEKSSFVKTALISKSILLQDFLNLDKDQLFALIERVHKRLEKGEYGLTAIYNAIPSADIVPYPGFTNPLYLSHLMMQNDNSNKEFSINPGFGRVYNFIDADNVGNFNIPKLQNLFQKQAKGLDNILLCYRILKTFIRNTKQNKAFSFLSKAFSFLADTMVYSNNKKMQQYIHKAISDIIAKKYGYDEAEKLKNYKDLCIKLSPNSNTDTDSLQTIFDNALVGQTQKLDNANIVKKETILFIGDRINKLNHFQKEFHTELLNGFGGNFKDMDSAISKIPTLCPFCRVEAEKACHGQIYLDKLETSKIKGVELVNFTGKIEIDLKKHFPNIFSKSSTFVPMELKLLNAQNNKIIRELLTDCSDRTVSNTYNDKNSMVLTARTAILQLKFAETLSQFLDGKVLEKPLFVIINTPSDKAMENILSSLDHENLAEHNIFIKKTATKDVHKTYNSIPDNANIVIFANYSTVAEGLRLARIDETIIAGYLSNTSTALQACSRTFHPKKKNNVSNIYLAGEKSSIKMATNRKTLDFIFELAKNTDISKGFLAAENYAENEHTLLSVVDKTTSVSFTSLSQRDMYDFSRMHKAMVESLNFMGAKHQGSIQEVPPHILSQKKGLKEEALSVLPKPKRGR